MKRGRPATRGIDDAVTIAQKRGCVMRVTYSPESVCDFFIRTVTFVIFVRVVRFEKIVAPANEIGHECRGIIAELRLFPQSLQIQTELWVYSKHGTYRFFRLTGAGLEEIPQNGEPGTAAPAGDETRPDEAGAGETPSQTGLPLSSPSAETPLGESVSSLPPVVNSPSENCGETGGSGNKSPVPGD
jgi:hypothetical protein